MKTPYNPLQSGFHRLNKKVPKEYDLSLHPTPHTRLCWVSGVQLSNCLGLHRLPKELLPLS
ncbi:MAG: hypothetical protein F6J93_18155 [Oscillatoria sp. SIO1A7]|nr:hypothetical protein [Oscillatoria sp. SIO1A7]